MLQQTKFLKDLNVISLVTMDFEWVGRQIVLTFFSALFILKIEWIITGDVKVMVFGVKVKQK